MKPRVSEPIIQPGECLRVLFLCLSPLPVHSGAAEGRKLMKTTTFKIDGMRCDGCARTIEALVTGAPGVNAATVSFNDREARIVFDPQATDEAQLTATIEKPGYRVVNRL